MTEIPENLKAAMTEYALQHNLMDSDHGLKELNEIRDELLRQVNDVDLQIEKESARYMSKMMELEGYIQGHVFELGTTVTHEGVKASHRSGYERITWDNKKMSSILLSNPNLAPIFTPARKVTEVRPSVSVVYVGEEISKAYSREDYQAEVEP